MGGEYEKYTLMKTELLVTKNTWPSPDHCKQNEGEAVVQWNRREAET